MLLGLTTFFVGCDKIRKNVKYECSAGLSIVLPNNFYEKNYVAYTYYLESPTAVFFALKEDKSLFGSRVRSQRDYLNAVMSANSMSEPLKEHNGGLYFTYENAASGKNFFYLAAAKESESSFWLCQFACEDYNKDSYEAKFLDWIDTIEVSQ